MRTYPIDSSDKVELQQLNVEEWQVELLKLNPDYPHWGCYEDYMMKDNGGWDSRVIQENWQEHSSWGLDDYNELVNFYFELYRANHKCPDCEGSGLNAATKKLSDDWYDFAGTGRRWIHNIGEAEVEALVKAGRLRGVGGLPSTYYDDERKTWVKWVDGNKVDCEQPEYPTPEEVNEWSKKGFGHDSINQWICVRARAESLGIYGHCEHCFDGYVYDEEKGKVALQLWYLHPRKGCSRGVYVKEIKQEDLQEVYTLLSEAAKRNAERFAKIPVTA